MRNILTITDGRAIRAYGFSKDQVSQIDVYLSEECSLSGLERGQIRWMVQIAGTQHSIELQDAFDKFYMLELTEKAQIAENEVIETTRGWNTGAVEIYEKYNLYDEYINNLW